MNRLLEEAFCGFASTSLAGLRTEFVNSAWPKLEVAETEKQITVSAEIPGMEEKDVELPVLWRNCHKKRIGSAPKFGA